MSGARAFWNLKLTHPYFMDGVAGMMEAKPTGETLNLIRRRGLIWQRRAVNEWTLLAIDDAGFDRDDIGVFELSMTDNQLTYVTDLDLKWGTEYYEIEVTESNASFRMNTLNSKVELRRPGIFARLKCALGQMVETSGPNTTTLMFDSNSLYWEFNFVPRDRSMDKMLVMEDSRQEIIFTSCEPVDFMGTSVFRCRSKQKIIQSQSSDYNLCLYEIVNGLKRPLMRRIPAPQPGRFPTDSKESVSTLLYF